MSDQNAINRSVVNTTLNSPQSIVLFDGVCHMCQAIVLFTIKRDKQEQIHFAPLQSEFGLELLEKLELPTSNFDTFVFVDNGKVYTKSTAALHLFKKLHRLWPLLYVFIIVPRILRDPVYSFIAKNRYKWFGKSEQCMIPTSHIRSRFIE